LYAKEALTRPAAAEMLLRVLMNAPKLNKKAAAREFVSPAQRPLFRINGYTNRLSSITRAIITRERDWFFSRLG
jgi:hypothetical protein